MCAAHLPDTRGPRREPTRQHPRPTGTNSSLHRQMFQGSASLDATAMHACTLGAGADRKFLGPHRVVGVARLDPDPGGAVELVVEPDAWVLAERHAAVYIEDFLFALAHLDGADEAQRDVQH